MACQYNVCYLFRVFVLQLCFIQWDTGKTARYLLYAFRKFPGLLPFALYVASAGIAALGAGFFTVMAFMAPLTLLICEEAHMNKLIGAIAINCGALSGANFMTSGSGSIFRGLMDEGGYTDVSFRYSSIILLQVSSSLCFLLHFSNSFLEADKMLTMKLPLRNRKLILHCRRKICT